MAQANGTWRDRIRRAFQSRDEGELENAINDLPDHAELHLHIPSKEKKEAEAGGGDLPPTDNIGSTGQMPAMMDRAFKAHDSELEEIWQVLAGNNRARDSFKARNARRKRMGIGDQEKEEEDEEEKKKNSDAFRDPPEAGGDGNRRILPGFEMEAPPGTADAHKARDSAFMADSYQQTCAYAEVLVPGIQMPTFDSAAAPKKTFDTLCSFRSKVLDLAWNNVETRGLIEDVTGGHFNGDVKTIDCQRVRDIFIAAGALRARMNAADNRRTSAPAVPDGASYPVGAATLVDVQKNYDEFWKARH